MGLYIWFLLIKIVVIAPYFVFLLLSFANHGKIKWKKPLKFLYLFFLVVLGLVMIDLAYILGAMSFV